MASMTVSFDTDYSFDMEGYANEALEEASKILVDKMKANARAVITHEGDSELVNSIKASKIKKANGAYIVNVGPRGYSKVKVYTRNSKGKKTSRTYPVSNALKAIWKEYGIPGRQEAAHAFIFPTATQMESQIQDLLQKKYEEKLK